METRNHRLPFPCSQRFQGRSKTDVPPVMCDVSVHQDALIQNERVRQFDIRLCICGANDTSRKNAARGTSDQSSVDFYCQLQSKKRSFFLFVLILWLLMGVRLLYEKRKFEDSKSTIERTRSFTCL